MQQFLEIGPTFIISSKVVNNVFLDKSKDQAMF